MADYERVLCVKNEVFVYKIPPRPSNRGYRASDWDLQNPQWTGRMRVVAFGKDLAIKLEDKGSGELFAKCPVETHPGVSVESVMDSSRYFVLMIKDDSGRTAFIGMGFSDRGDSFDLNVALQDHFKQLKQEVDLERATKEFESAPKLDLGFKEGQTIKINIGSKKSTDRPKTKPASGSSLGGLIPPPPGSGVVLAPPPGGAQHNTAPQLQQREQQPISQDVDLLSGVMSTNTSTMNSETSNNDPWGNFTSAGTKSNSGNGNSWVQF